MFPPLGGRWPANTLTVAALLNSGRLTAEPWRILAALSGDATTAGNSGRTRRGCKKSSSRVPPAWACSSCSKLCASSIVNSRTAVRLSSARCPPGPSFLPKSCASDRRYVPELTGAEANLLPVKREKFQFLYLDLLGLQIHGLPFARQSVRRDAGNFPG